MKKQNKEVHKNKAYKPNTLLPNSAAAQNTNIQRVERPIGLTMIMRRYHNEQNQANKAKLLNLAQQHILNRYVQEGLTLNGRQVNLDYLAAYLLMPKNKVIERMSEGAKAALGITKEGLGDAYRALLGMCLEMALGDRHIALKQYHTLQKAQGDAYKPFLSGTLNEAIRGVFDTSKTMLQVAKTMMPTTPQIAIQNNTLGNGSSVPNDKAIGANEAVMIIEASRKNGSILEDPEGKLQLYQTYVQGTELPQVIATKQIGMGQTESDDLKLPTLKRKVHSQRTDDVHNKEIIGD